MGEIAVALGSINLTILLFILKYIISIDNKLNQTTERVAMLEGRWQAWKDESLCKL